MTSKATKIPLPSEGPEAPILDWEVFSHIILNATTDGIVVVSPSGLILFANDKAQNALELPLGSLVQERYPALWSSVALTIEERRRQFGVPVQTPHGRHMAKMSAVLWMGSLIGVLIVFEDSTELEKITHEMLSFQQITRELDAIINISSDGLWISDENGFVIRINPASEKMNNIQADHVVGRNIRELLDEGFIDRSVTMEVLRTNSVVNLLQQTREGRKLIVTGNPLFDDQGKLTRVVVNERDISEIDRLHRELEEREAISDKFRQQMREMQMIEVESRRIIARSPSMLKALRQALKVSAVESTVLILGESGVGKGMIADIIHKHSSRSQEPIIKINCGAIPESLMETELFGYDQGAFTGALKKGKPGYLELADRGILFLDEIGELSLASQVKLLRFLEDGHVTRVGGARSRKLDVRILAATNRELDAMVRENHFRHDLYYRLNVIPISIPPLRERREDVLPLLQHYIDHFSRKFGSEKRLTKSALDVLLAYPFPGNVRELMNICERVAVMSEGDRIDLEDLPAVVIGSESPPCPPDGPPKTGRGLKEMVDRYERTILEQSLQCYGSQQRMAEALGVDQSTIARKLKKYGLR